MPRVRVWNDNKHTTWKEKFKGDDVVIKSGAFVEMEFYEAHEFKGQFSPIKVKGDGTQDETSFKMIRVEPITDSASSDEEIEAYPCNLCKKNYASEAALLKHSETSHADRMVTDAEAEQIVKRKPGRPAKVTEVAAD